MALVQNKGSRWKLTPDMRLAYSFDDREKKDRLAAARRAAGRRRDLLADRSNIGRMPVPLTTCSASCRAG